jgi:hypothetical protein
VELRHGFCGIEERMLAAAVFVQRAGGELNVPAGVHQGEPAIKRMAEGSQGAKSVLW